MPIAIRHMQVRSCSASGRLIPWTTRPSSSALQQSPRTRIELKPGEAKMPYITSAGIRLYYEEAGKGAPIVFVHEFADDLRSWEPQIRYFSRRYRCIAYN